MRLINGQKKKRVDFRTLAQAMIDPEIEMEYRFLRFGVLGLMFVIGIILWMYFFDFGRTGLNFGDWDEINLPRLRFLQDAFHLGVFPWHMLYTAPLHDADRFFSLPDVITSPQILLLYFIKARYFVYFDVLLHYAIAFISMIWIKKMLRLSLMAICFFFFLFGFNGYLIAHYSVGHFTWAAHFLFPLFFALMIRFSQGDKGWRWVASTAFLLFYMVLAGGEHQFVWLLIFMGLMIPAHWYQAGWMIAAMILAVLLSAVRLIPPALELPRLTWVSSASAAGYPSVMTLVQSMTQLISPERAYEPLFPYSYTELNLYIGFLGFIFVFYFGLVKWIDRLSSSGEFSKFVIPVFGMIFLSLSNSYNLIKALSIPLFNGERVSSRMIDVPFVFLLIVAAYFFQKWLNEHKSSPALFAAIAGFLVLVVHDLWANINLWSLRSIASLSKLSELDYSQMTLVGNHSDPIYFMIFYLGLTITLISMIILLYLSFREYKQERASQETPEIVGKV
jgi:hypothetical protein